QTLQARSGASSKIKRFKQDQTLNASAMERRVTFFVQSHKESNQRKGFSCFESKATSAVPAQAGATLGILPKVAPGARPCAPPFGCPWSRE
ncbi:hypothetical protein J7J64_23755, partial [Lysobacter sp. ISL-42]|uniref:hypothetical protein n=1 Tax=Lysobacter sp. ISL-42 TaxID=2819152 RepID=UPI001BE9408A